MHTYVYCSTIYNSRDLEPTQMPINDKLDKENVVYIYIMGYYAATKRNEIMTFAGTWMKLVAIILSKLTQQKIKHHMFSLISGSGTMRIRKHREGNNTHWDLLGVG